MEQTNLKSTRDGFGLGLLQAAQLDKCVAGICADLTDSVKMKWFKEQFPERFFEVGVAEQNLVGTAAGLALGGFVPFAASYACFSPANSWGVIRTAVCYNNMNVKIVGGHAGIVTGEDGATHQSLEDIAIMRVLPNMTVVVPADGEEARKATLAMARMVGPAYVRISKFEGKVISAIDSPFEIGKAITLQEGSDGTIIACGHLVGEALAAARELAQAGKQLRVINMHTIKPIDQTVIRAAAQETPLIFTVEDHQITGGLGSAVAEVLAELPNRTAHLVRLGMTDRFGESGSAKALLTKFQLDATSLVTIFNSHLAELPKSEYHELRSAS